MWSVVTEEDEIDREFKRIIGILEERFPGEDEDVLEYLCQEYVENREDSGELEQIIAKPWCLLYEKFGDVLIEGKDEKSLLASCILDSLDEECSIINIYHDKKVVEWAKSIWIGD